ncbi:MAG TPA: hypothetical protein VHA56_13260 [Mucilaginibacter sp.]|nr:hypothetical protein [Mucilaginibacter sp.]
MENHPFDTVALNSEVIDWYRTIYETLKDKFNIQVTGDIDFQLDQFELFRDLIGVNIRGSYVIKHDDNNDCYILFVETHSQKMGRHGIADVRSHQVWALAYLKCDFGRVVVRRETLTDKIIELVHPVELDFTEDKPFSDTFYVLVNDRDKATQSIGRNFRNAVMDVRADDFMIEIVEHNLIIGSHDQISPQRAVHLAEFVCRICSNC